MVSLHLDALASKHNKKELLRALDVLPAGLDETYRNALDKIRGQCADDVLLAKRILFWVSYALRPLIVDELKYALAVELGARF